MENSFKRILIASDLSEMDDRLMSFVAQLSKRVKVEKVYLLHIIPNMLVPEKVELEFHKMFTTEYPIDEKVKDMLKDKSMEHFDGSGFKVDIEVVEGKASKKLLEMVKLKEIDLLVIGNKEQSEGSGITARRVARKVDCNVLFVPTTLPKAIESILVPVDFSDYAVRALKTALILGKETATITALNIVNLMLSDRYYGVPVDPDHRKQMMDIAWDYFANLQKSEVFKNDHFKKEVVVNEHNNVSAQLRDYLGNNDFDMVVMGAKGHSVFEYFLMGSVTESFVNTYNKKPILVIR